LRNISTKLTLAFLLSVALFNLKAYAQKAELVVQTGHTNSVYSVAFSPDGHTLASGSRDNTLKLWNWQTGQELRTLKWNANSFASPTIAFSPDGKILAAQTEGDIKLWDVETGKELRTVSGLLLGLSPDSKQLLALTAIDSGKPKLLDIQTGQEFAVAYSNNSPFSKYTALTTKLSSDRKILATGSADKTVKLWDFQTGQELKTFLGHSEVVISIAFSPDGKLLASGSSDETIKLWDIASGQAIKTIKGHAGDVLSVAFSSDGKIIVSGSEDRTIKLWDVASGLELKNLTGAMCPVTELTVTLRGGMLVTNCSDTIKLWDLASRKGVIILKGHTAFITSFDISPEGKILASSGFDKTIKLWDMSSGQLLKTMTQHGDVIQSIRFSPTGNLLVSDTKQLLVSDSSKLWDVAAGQGQHLSQNLSDKTFLFLPDGKMLVMGRAMSEGVFRLATPIKLWDVATGQELSTLQDSDEISKFVLSPDGKKAAGAGIMNSKVGMWDVATGRKLATLEMRSGDFAFSPDSKILASNNYVDIKLHDVETGRLLQSFRIDDPTSTRKVFAIVPDYYLKSRSEPITPDGRFQFKEEENGRINLYEVDSGKLLASLFMLGKEDWAVITPEGLFDASTGARHLMHYVIGHESVSLEQMKDIYYIPGLLQKIFKGEPLPKVELFSKKDLFPRVEYEPLKPNQKQLIVKLTNRGGGIGQVQVLFNGKELIADARPTSFNPNLPSATLTIDLSKAAIKAGQENRIAVVARNAAGSLSTRGATGAEIVYRDKSNSSIEPPNIYAIVGGVSDYTGDKLDLNFAAKDAEEFARTIELGALKLLNGDKSKVHIRLLTSTGEKANIKFSAPDAKTSTATKADFIQAFSDFSNATSKDVFIVYLAGHGISLNLNQSPNQAGGDTYLYLTQEATTNDKSVLAVENMRRAMAISSEELKDLMKQNKALKQVLILDTCAAGALSNSLVSKRDLPSDQIRAIERLKDSTGFFVLMGSSADAYSYEASQYGQGLLTYSLLQGMKGARLRESQFADVGLLFDYAQETVPLMAKNIGGTQRPLIIIPDKSNSFDIGKFTIEEQKQINLLNPKPVILRPNLRNVALRFDNLKLTQMMAEQLRQASYAQSRGEQTWIVFVEADEMTDAIQPVGDYIIEGDTLKISMILVRNNAPFGKEINVNTKILEAEKAIKQLVEAVIQSLQ
jgi:WD40 repeat protein